MTANTQQYDVKYLVKKLGVAWELEEQAVVSFLRKKSIKTIAELLGITSDDCNVKLTVQIRNTIKDYFLKIGQPLPDEPNAIKKKRIKHIA